MADPRVLIGYHTVQGQAAKIAERIAQVLRDDAVSVDVASLDSAPPPEGYDAVVLGDSIHVVKHSRELKRYLRDHEELLAGLHTALFQVSLTSTNPDEEHTATARSLVQDLLDDTGFDPDVVGMFAGNLAYTRYGWLKKRAMRAIVKREGGSLDMSHDHEYTDWDAVEHFAHDVASLARTGVAGPGTDDEQGSS
jgi:menaquinone-dependent protoporphyrinogen oxidase